MASGVLQRLRADGAPLTRDVVLNASGTLAMLVGGWLIAADRGLAHLPRSTGIAAIAVTVAVVSAIGAAVLITWWESDPLLGKLRDLGVNVVANLFAAALVWLLLLVTGRIGPGPEMVIAAALILALPLLIWFKFARDVGVNLLSTVVVLSGSWLIAVADGSVASSLPITVAAVAGVLLPAAALAVLVTVDVRASRRHADRTARLARTISIELAANLVAAAAVALALAAFGLLRIDVAVAFLAMQFLMLPVMILLPEAADEVEYQSGHGVYSVLARGLYGLLYLLLLAIVMAFPYSLWKLLGKPDLRCFALVVVLGFIQLCRVTSRRRKELGEKDPRYLRLRGAAELTFIPVWTTAGLAVASIIGSPDTPGWLRETLKFIVVMISAI